MDKITEDEFDEMREVLLFQIDETIEEAVNRVFKELFGDRHFDAKAETTIRTLIKAALI